MRVAQIRGLDAWGPAYVKAKRLVSQLTLEEKVIDHVLKKLSM